MLTQEKIDAILNRCLVGWDKVKDHGTEKFRRAWNRFDDMQDEFFAILACEDFALAADVARDLQTALRPWKSGDPIAPVIKHLDAMARKAVRDERW